MNSRLPRVVFSGILGGALVGFLIGMYVVVLTEGHVIRHADYAASLFYQQSQSRYRSTMLLAFVVVFAAIGPVVASASFGGWIRQAVYGLVSAIAIVVCATLVAAALTDQQPINMMKGSPRTYIDFARIFAVPIAMLVGPIAGILIGRFRGRRSPRLTPSEKAN